jgi:hypothetical protein
VPALTPGALRARARAWLPDADDDTPERDASLDAAADAQGAPPHETLGFALNAWMSGFADADDEVLSTTPSADPVCLAVDEGSAPLGAMGAVAGARLAGARVAVHSGGADAVLMRAFWSFDREVAIHAGNPPLDCRRVAPDPDTCAAALLDGRETDDDYEALAQDVLALGGRGERSVRLILAPGDLTPDAFLGACASLRALLPAEDASTARLRMAVAFAEKNGTPAAYLDDFSLLVTRGDALVLPPGQVRWVALDDLSRAADVLASVRTSALTRRDGSARYADLDPQPLGTALLPRGRDLIGG